jgi:dTDP-4-dehydrorhamnose 3,5-epimerase
MDIISTSIEGCIVLAVKRFEDSRGFFEELYNEDRYEQAAGLRRQWRQVNCSRSRRHVVRGLHLAPFAKLVSCLKGEIFDVVVDLRRDSPSYRRWNGWRLSETNNHQVYVPPGCAHGFMALADDNLVVYLQTDTYNPKAERSLFWRDPTIGIEWPAASEYILSDKDLQAPPFQEG